MKTATTQRTAAEHTDQQPVLVGVGTATQRAAVLEQSAEPLDLMLQAVRRAGSDSGAPALLAQVQRIAVPQGRWRYRNPAGEIARNLGCVDATSILAGVGVLQQSLISDACQRIAAGEIDAALIAGADAGHRILTAKRQGLRAPERQQEDDPHEHLRPEEPLLHPAELRAGIRLPVALYALIESACRARDHVGLREHRQRLADRYARFSEIAAANPAAWRRARVEAAAIRDASDANPMQAFPYTRRHCSSWNVDQAGALLLCSAAKARALGIPAHRWIHPWAAAECNHMVPVSARSDLSANPGARSAAQVLLRSAGLAASEVDLLDLYSCFPIAVQAHAEALGITHGRDLTVTGGMPFAGGPFNNYVLQATCRMAELLRQGAGRTGLVSSVSGILTKHAFGLWASRPALQGFSRHDVSAQTAKAGPDKTVLSTYEGTGRIAGYTIIHESHAPPRALVLADTPGGDRVLAWNADAATIDRMRTMEHCGVSITMTGDTFTPI
ncbi:acetyl-CoA acetyltransferase [Verticiella sediminum]|uniref:Acetyl-CoA acetyltransferase n=1 Tax=Verticiella sediminum TaxID=1247510 RepID=A0A556AGM0_9BURK|nr:acetyl-CoA acetyltransferase [Verticiella sediminum]TSH92022.1 acetyl-CoA acetyltransferase [Verticiella sediminum]